MSLYCPDTCVHLDYKKKYCKEWKQKLGYMKRTGNVSFTVFETCDECRQIFLEDGDTDE